MIARSACVGAWNLEWFSALRGVGRLAAIDSREGWSIRLAREEIYEFTDHLVKRCREIADYVNAFQGKTPPYSLVLQIQLHLLKC